MRVLITGGAGFVGSSIALNIAQKYTNSEITVFDNLKRRGSEMNLEKFRKNNIRFVHGDIRNSHDFDTLKSQTFDLFIEASAEPSVLAGLDGAPNYLLETNLFGSFHCFEFARKNCGFTQFLSTSRVYSLDPLRAIQYGHGESRFEILENQSIQGCSRAGISEQFPTDSARSLYGMTKLASEYLFQEYCNTYGMKGCISRCGVIVGPGQFGKVDQGVFTMWVANHVYGIPLKYIGFDGSGRQVRDLLHPDDLFDALELQVENSKECQSKTYNLGGGVEVSTSLLELTTLCRDVCGTEVEVLKMPVTSPVDIPIYVSDCAKFSEKFSWKPKRNVRTIFTDIHQWLVSNQEALRPIFVG